MRKKRQIEKGGVKSAGQGRPGTGGEAGSVTVFFLICLGAVFLVLFLVLNGTRYLLAVQNTEQALAAATASLLSHYDRELMLEMGLFALEEDAVPQDVGKGYLDENLNQGSFFGEPKCRKFSWQLAEAGRLSRPKELGRQLSARQRTEGWLSLGRRLLQFVGTDELRRGLGLLEELKLEEGGEGDDPAVWPDGKDSPPEGGEISLWQFLLPWPPEGYPGNPRLPANASGREEESRDSLALEPSGWSILTEDLSGLKEQGRGIAAYGGVLGEALIKGLLQVKEKILRIEYYMQQLDFATAAPLYDRFFCKAEVEYLICGRPRAWENLQEMAMRLFYIRSLLQITPRLVSGQVTEPLAAALAIKEGLKEAKEDVEELFSGRRISAIPGQAQPTMSYQDFLRIFLLIQDGDVQLVRLQSLLGANLAFWAGGPVENDAGPGAVLHNYGTVVELEVQVEANLWPFGRFGINRSARAGYDLSLVLEKKPTEVESPEKGPSEMGPSGMEGSKEYAGGQGEMAEKGDNGKG